MLGLFSSNKSSAQNAHAPRGRGLRALATVEAVDHVALQSEGPIVSGRAYLVWAVDRFLEFYFNEKTGTMAFALIEEQRRIWGIDRDNIRGWHLHPRENQSR